MRVTLDQYKAMLGRGRRPIAQPVIHIPVSDEAKPDMRTMSWSVRVKPMGAPRMTLRDKWKKRPCVERYWAFRDTLRAHVGTVDSVPDELHCTFYTPMPKSWSEKKRVAMDGKGHKTPPDCDNLVKSVQDAIFKQDGGIWISSQKKVWCREGHERIEIAMTWHERNK